MKTHNPLNLHSLERAVREATDSNQPGTVSRYLTKIELYASKAPSVSARHSAYHRAYQTLLETICDSLIDRHWRLTCLDQIHRPIFALRRLATTPSDLAKIRAMHAELARLSHYFL